ncbi:MAG: amidohydrolase family protein [Firmicutes bacterium]|jgi:predicted TIM-barrel fold metal-dependent hydrolase|nr:amidohydrolase family protein [Bacillota bacterium]
MIIDGHSHILQSDFGSGEQYLAALQEAGIDMGIVVPGGTVDVRRMTDYIIGRAKPSPDPPDNGYIQSAVDEAAGKLMGFCCFNPYAQGAPEMLENAFQSGFRGLKLSPMSHQFSFASRAVAELAAICGDYGLPLYSHVLYNPGASTERFISLARQFPKTNFILGHMGFGPADQDALQAAVELDNFFLETSTGSYLTIKQAVERAGASKIIFGGEFPLSHPKVELTKILALKLSDDALEQILGGNIWQLVRF